MVELNHISHSQLSMWQRCPRQWEYRYVHGLKEAPSGALIIGGAYHRAVEINFRQKVESKVDLPLSDCCDAFSDAWNLSLSEEERINWEEDDPSALKDLGVLLVGTYITTMAPKIQPTWAEKFMTPEVAGVPLHIRIDLEDINHNIIDHKTSSKAYNQADIDRDTQASAAAFALNRAIIYYNHVAIKSSTPRIQPIRTVRLKEDITWWVTMATGIIKQMESGVAPPRPEGWHCSPRYCGYYEHCRGGLTRSYQIEWR